ncbi:MAG: alpha/beta hydrolase [Lachnospiraceae bacterium]|nr:alpha/beta hydrolase [Lachnospiraceae bacterium]
MEQSRGKKSIKSLKVIGIILAFLIVLFGALSIVSHAVYHRSNMATLSELYIRISGTKAKFEDVDECAAYIEKRAGAESYVLNTKLKSTVTEESINGSRVYTLSPSAPPEYIILYLHGGAYINDANANYFKICDNYTQKLNAEVIFPIYPLAPNHTWDETFAILTELYMGKLKDASVPVIVMGDSAGGGLSVAFCEYLDELGQKQPDKLLLFSPWMDISMSNPEAADYEKADPMLSAYGLVEMGKCWAGDLDLHDYKVSPIFGNISSLQNVYLFVGTREIFYPDVTDFYDMLKKFNINTELVVGEGLNHVYPLYPIPEADDAFEQICDIIQNR